MGIYGLTYSLLHPEETVDLTVGPVGFIMKALVSLERMVEKESGLDKGRHKKVPSHVC